MSSVEALPTCSQSKTMERAFSIPIVLDTYTCGLATLTSLASPLQPSLTSLLASLTPVVESQVSRIRSLLEARLPEVVATRLTSARDQVTAGVNYLDSSLCSGLDQMIVKVPSLTSSTPALYSTSKEAAVSHLTLATTYLASFTLAQLALKASDSGLQTADSLLKLVPASYSTQCEPLVSGLRNVRSQAEHVRREGARRNGSEQVANMETSSLAFALSEVLGLHYIFSIIGFKKQVAEAAGVVVKEEIPEKVVTAAEVSEKVATAAAEVSEKVVTVA